MRQEGAPAHEVYALVKYKDLPVAQACQATLALCDDERRGDKGLIALDKHGNIALEFNSDFMRCAYRVGHQAPVVAMWKDE